MKKKLLAFLLAAAMLFSLCACGGGGDSTQTQAPASQAPATQQPENNTPDDNPATEPGTEEPGTEEPGTEEPGDENGLGYTITEFDPDKKYTYRTSSSIIPGNWNPLDYEGNDASTILSPLIDALYTFIFNDELHPLDDPTRTPYDGYVVVPQMASDMPIDVTEEVKALHPDWIPADATEGYAWAVPLRDDLYFDTGYHITAETFVQSMKYLLDPKLQNYRATDAYTAPRGLLGAEAYANDWAGKAKTVDNGDAGYTMENFTKNDEGQYMMGDYLVYIGIDVPLSWCGGETLKSYVENYGDAYFGLEHWDELAGLANEEGLVPCTDDNLALLATVTTTVEAWGETEDDLPNYLIIHQGYYPDEMVFEDIVGCYAKDEYTVVNVFVNPISGFYLYYGGLKDTLVEPDVYEASLSQDESGAWQSNYMTSKETSPSYGPYSMSEYQTDKMVHYVRNESYYGWHDDVYHVYKDPVDGNVYRFNQATEYDIQQVSEIATNRNMFLAGELAGYGLQPEDYEQYGLSEYAYTSPSDSVFFLLLTGDMEGIEARENADGFDKSKNDLETITIEAFRKAFAISFDRQAFCNEVHPAYAPGFGIFGTTVIYDPDTAGIYRDTDEAKQALCDFYSVDASKFASLDDAVDSITGYDPVTAKELYKQAFDEALELGYITDEDGDGICDQEIVLTYSMVDANEIISRRVKFLNDHVGEVLSGTPFEGKISFVESAPLGDPGGYDAIKNGTTDIMISGWTGSAMDPYYLLFGAYASPANAYAKNWYDTSADMITLNINGEEITMSMYDWASAANGNTVVSNGKSYKFGANDADAKTRLQILAACENALLQTYTYIPMVNAGSKSLLSQQLYYVIEDYNPVLGRGGTTYMKFNYDDEEWAAYCAEQIAEHGALQY